MDFSSEYLHLVPKGSFFLTSGTQMKIFRRKIHLFYRMIKVQISGGLLTDYIIILMSMANYLILNIM